MVIHSLFVGSLNMSRWFVWILYKDKRERNRQDCQFEIKTEDELFNSTLIQRTGVS